MDRICSRCGKTLPESHFTRRARRARSWDSFCRACRREYGIAWWAEHRPATRKRGTPYAAWRKTGLKICRDCGEEKPISEFRIRSGTVDSPDSYCWPCGRARVRGYLRSPEGKAAMRRAYRNRDRRKHWVQVFTRAAIQIGLLVRQPCEVCGVTQVHAHHDDYGQPLSVRWLCQAHHAAVHTTERDAARGPAPSPQEETRT